MINLSHIKLSYGERTLFNNSNLLINPNEKIGLVGPNGSGKSSLFRLIAGEETPDEGTVTVIPGHVVGYFSGRPGNSRGKAERAGGKLFRRLENAYSPGENSASQSRCSPH